jgi:hypothetical protein
VRLRSPHALYWLAGVSVVGLAARLVGATRVGFGDSEALYACYALHPQPAYVDHPGLVGMLASILGGGTSPTPLAAHVTTALAATAAPWAIVLAARALGANGHAALAAGLGFALVPEIAVGLFAMTPDLPLFFAWTLALALAGVGLAARPGTNRAAAALVVAGLSAGVACASKATGATLLAALLVTYFTPAARGHARTVWPWLGLAAGLVVVYPIALFEARTGWPMLRHRFVDTQHDAGLSLRNAGAIVFGQAAYLSPLVAIAAVRVGWDAWHARKDDCVSALLASATFVPLLALLPLCLWSRVAEPHWLAPALLALPLHYARCTVPEKLLSRRFATWCTGTSGFLSASVYVWVLVPALVQVAPERAYDPKVDIANELYGWPDVIAAVRQVAAAEWVPLSTTDDLVVVGPHWTVCAQLHAALRTELPVGCADLERDDFDDWNPRSRWLGAETVLFVSDNRFIVDTDALFPDHMKIRESRLGIVRGGKVARIFSIAVLQRRARA